MCNKCGDGIKVAQEACDDWNSSDGDGCDSECNIEMDWSCVGEENRNSICNLCGDGIR